MTNGDGLDAATVVLLVLGAIILLPFLTMGLGFGGMMGYGGMMGGYGGTGTGWSLVGFLLQLAVLGLLLGGGYLLLKRIGTGGEGSDGAMAELRRAYAKGDLTDDEFERRRERLQREE